MQCVAACCSVLQRVAACCSVLQCVAVCCSVLQCVSRSRVLDQDKYACVENTSTCPLQLTATDSTHCNTLKHTATHCNTLQHTATDSNIPQQSDQDKCTSVDAPRKNPPMRFPPRCHSNPCCSVLQCAAVCCSMLRCVAVHCSVLQCGAMCCSVWPRQHEF